LVYKVTSRKARGVTEENLVLKTIKQQQQTNTHTNKQPKPN
jgi:hypothetical protein